MTEEVWSLVAGRLDPPRAWPARAESRGPGRTGEPGPTRSRGARRGAEVLGEVRRAKTTDKRSMRAGGHLTVTDTAERIAALLSAEGDLVDAGGVDNLVTSRATGPRSRVELAPDE